MKGIGMPRLLGQDLAINRLGLGEASGLVMLHGSLQQVLDHVGVPVFREKTTPPRRGGGL
jgi:hypothetical protein